MKFISKRNVWNTIVFKKHSAFLLSEILVSLLILILILSMIDFLLTSYHNNRERLFYNESNWEIAMLRLDQMTAGAQLVQADDKRVLFKTAGTYKFPHKKYQLQIYHHMLRITGEHEGHVPLLLNQRQLNFNVRESVLKITAIDRWQRKWEFYLEFQ